MVQINPNAHIHQTSDVNRQKKGNPNDTKTDQAKGVAAKQGSDQVKTGEALQNQILRNQESLNRAQNSITQLQMLSGDAERGDRAALESRLQQAIADKVLPPSLTEMLSPEQAPEKISQNLQEALSQEIQRVRQLEVEAETITASVAGQGQVTPEMLSGITRQLSMGNQNPESQSVLRLLNG